MEASGPLVEIIERCVQRVASGETLDTVLRSYPEQAAELRAMLGPAQMIMTAPIAPPRQAASSLALNRMLSEVQSAAAQPRERSFVRAWFGSLKARPLAYQAIALAGAVILFGGVGFGASAATGTAPSPVRRILRISSDSQRKITLKGTIISIEGDTLTLRPAAGAAMDVRTVIVTASTRISRQDQRITRGELRGGDVIEIEATLQDGRIEATSIRAGGAPSPAGASDATSAAHVPASGTPDGDGGDNQPGGPSHDGGTPAAGATPEPGDDSDGDATPEPGNDHGGDDGTQTPRATATASHNGDAGTPSATEHPEETHEPGPTEEPERTKTPAGGPSATPKPQKTEEFEGH
jgi:hypothetical protein